MRPFRERNPIPIGVVGLLVIVALLLIAFKAGSLPFITSGHTVYADFADAANLQKGNNVRVAGVQVGKVTSVKLVGNVVRVGMKVTSDVNADSTAAIKIETLLGQVYVALTPEGSAPLPHNTIPVAHTTTPTSITSAFQGLGRRAGEIDVKQLAKSFKVLSTTFQHTPTDVRRSLHGLERLSTTIASRDSELRSLLDKANGVTGTLEAHDAQIARLISDSNLILTTVKQQRAVIHDLLVHTAALAQQLTGLVADNRAVIGPALDHLHSTLQLLRQHQTQLREVLHLAAPFARDFTDTLGNGRWFETIVSNLTNGAGKVSLGNTGSR